MRVEIDVIRLSSELFRPVLHLALSDDVVPVAAFVSNVLCPIKFTRKSAFAFFASIPRLTVVAKMFLFPVFGERAAIDEYLVTG